MRRGVLKVGSLPTRGTILEAVATVGLAAAGPAAGRPRSIQKNMKAVPSKLLFRPDFETATSKRWARLHHMRLRSEVVARSVFGCPLPATDGLRHYAACPSLLAVARRVRQAGVEADFLETMGMRPAMIENVATWFSAFHAFKHGLDACL